MRRSITMLVVLLVAGIAFVTPNASAALPLLDLDCGDDVDRSGRLEGEITDCDGAYGLRITKSGITLDLNGKQIVADGGLAGIFIQDGINGVTIRNGTVSGFEDGIIGLDTSRTTISDVLLTNLSDSRGIELVDQSFRPGRNTVKDSVVLSDHSVSIGIALVGDSSKVLRSTVYKPGSVGIDVVGARAVVLDNTTIGSAGDGFNLNVENGRVARNNSLSNLSFGFNIQYEGTANLVDNNDAYGNSFDGFHVEEDDSDAVMRFRDNASHFNGDLGFEFAQPIDLRAARNYAFENNDGGCTDVDDVVACNADSSLPDLVDENDDPLICGDEVTKSGRLIADVVNCNEHGLVVNTPNITLDLNSKRIAGDEEDDDALADLGIKLGPLAKNVRIRNGSVSGFDAGIDLSQTEAEEFFTPGVKVANVFMDSMDDTGVDLDGSGIGVSRVAVFAVGAQVGIEVEGAKARVSRSTIEDSDGIGINVNGTTAAAVGNLVVHGGGTGITTSGARNRATSNRLVMNDTGIAAGGSSPVVSGNDSHANTNGIDVSEALGRITLTGNDAHSNIQFGFDGTVTPPATVRARGNIAFGNGTNCDPSTIC